MYPPYDDRAGENRGSRGCYETQNANATLRAGSIAKDRIPSEEIKLIMVPLKQSHLSFNLSDSSFETMGDKVADTLDMSHEKVYTGEEAAELNKKMEHNNCTKEKYE